MSSSQIPEFMIQATRHAQYGQVISGNSGELNIAARSVSCTIICRSIIWRSNHTRLHKIPLVSLRQKAHA
jgi:hypothetical protein